MNSQVFQFGSLNQNLAFDITFHTSDKFCSLSNYLFSFFRFYKGLVPLWARQIPYTMMKFASFERTVEALYAYVVPKPRAQCSKGEQLVVTFVAGYIGRFLIFLEIYSSNPD